MKLVTLPVGFSVRMQRKEFLKRLVRGLTLVSWEPAAFWTSGQTISIQEEIKNWKPSRSQTLLNLGVAGPDSLPFLWSLLQSEALPLLQSANGKQMNLPIEGFGKPRGNYPRIHRDFLSINESEPVELLTCTDRAWWTRHLPGVERTVR